MNMSKIIWLQPLRYEDLGFISIVCPCEHNFLWFLTAGQIKQAIHDTVRNL